MTKKPRRKSIYVGKALQALLDTHNASDEEAALRSTSALINAVADRYTHITRHSRPLLSVNEWLLVFDALNGVWLSDNASLSLAGVAFGVADAIQLDQIDRKWSVDGPALVDQLRSLSTCELLAVVDAAEQFWSGRFDRGEYPEIVAAIVGNVKPAEN